IERTTFNAPRLLRLQDELRTEGVPPSRRLADLAHLLAWLDAPRNLYFALIAPFLLVTTRTALALEDWRRRAGPALGRWLAAVGAPVRARRLRLTPLALGATLRVQDSLQRGESRFYAEITRLRQTLDLARGPTPLLFLLDELLSGTNSADRRAGAEAVLRRLV